MRVFGLAATVVQMDAEQTQFPDNSFDLIWTWGVIHHSANTRKILEEMRRVLRPGGEALVMVYHRTFWEYYAQGAMLAILSGQIFKPSALHASIQRRTDGAIARYYKRSEWEQLVSDLFAVEDSPRLRKENGTRADARRETQRFNRRHDTELLQPFSHQPMPMGIVSGDKTGQTSLTQSQLRD